MNSSLIVIGIVLIITLIIGTCIGWGLCSMFFLAKQCDERTITVEDERTITRE